MPSTAAWSAATPCPPCRPSARTTSAAASVTRTSSRARLRSGLERLGAAGLRAHARDPIALRRHAGAALGTDAAASPGCRWRRRSRSCGAPRRPATTTCGARRRTGRTPSRRSRSRAAWTERMRLGTGIAGVFTRGPALLAPARGGAGRRVRGALRARHRLLLRRDRRALERHPLRAPAHARCARRSRPCARSSPASAARAASGSRRRRPIPCPIYVAALRERMLRARGRARRRHVRQLPPAVRGRARGGDDRRAARGTTSSAASSASRGREEGLAAGPPAARRLRHRARLRGLLPLARLGRARSTRWSRVARGRPPAGRRARPGRPRARGVPVRRRRRDMRERLAAFAAAGITSLCLDPVGAARAAGRPSSTRSRRDERRPAPGHRRPPALRLGHEHAGVRGLPRRGVGPPDPRRRRAVRAPLAWRRSSPGCRG